jgi:hypothetical protein
LRRYSRTDHNGNGFRNGVRNEVENGVRYEEGNEVESGWT